MIPPSAAVDALNQVAVLAREDLALADSCDPIQRATSRLERIAEIAENRKPDEPQTLTEVHIAEVLESEDGHYAFADPDDRDRFADAVRKSRGCDPERDHEDVVFLDSLPIEGPGDTDALIAGELGEEDGPDA